MRKMVGYSQFFVSENKFTLEQYNFQKCIILGNWTMLFSFIVLLITLVMTFGFEHLLPLSIQVAGHIFTIISASLLKLGYVIRCVGVHGLGYKIF